MIHVDTETSIVTINGTFAGVLSGGVLVIYGTGETQNGAQALINARLEQAHLEYLQEFTAGCETFDPSFKYKPQEPRNRGRDPRHRENLRQARSVRPCGRRERWIQQPQRNR